MINIEGVRTVGCGKGITINGEDFDEIKAQRDAGLIDIKRLTAGRDGLQLLLNERDEQLDAQRLRADTAEAKAADYLSAWEKCAEFRDAAEQRIAELEAQLQQAVNLLSEARSLIPDFGGSKRFSAFRLNFPKFINAIGFTRTGLPKKVDAALNQKSEGESHVRISD